MKPLDLVTYAVVVSALKKHRVAKFAADEAGVSGSCAWRIAKREHIQLVSLAEHQRKRLADPAFRAKQIPAARKAASAWLKKQHGDPLFHRKSAVAASKNLKRLNRDPAFRSASATRLKLKYADPAFRQKQAVAASMSQLKRRARRKQRLLEKE
jgi:hypothetical protein